MVIEIEQHSAVNEVTITTGPFPEGRSICLLNYTYSYCTELHCLRGRHPGSETTFLRPPQAELATEQAVLVPIWGVNGTVDVTEMQRPLRELELKQRAREWTNEPRIYPGGAPGHGDSAVLWIGTL